MKTTHDQTGGDDDTMARLHERLVREARRDELLDIAYRTVDSPVGALLLAATPAGLVRVAFASEGHPDVLERLAASISPRILEAPGRLELDVAASQLDEYFAGRRRDFDLTIDLQLLSGFRRNVVEHLREIAYGTTASYAALAATAGSPKAVRAVGTAIANNPIPVVMACHRVIRSDGTIGQYLGGPEVKRALLDLESTAHPRK